MSVIRNAANERPAELLAGHLDGVSMLLRRSCYTGLLPAPTPEMFLAFSLSNLCDQVVTISENMERVGLPAKASYHRLTALPEWQNCLESGRAIGGDGPDPESWRESLGAIAGPLSAAIDEMNDQIEMSLRDHARIGARPRTAVQRNGSPKSLRTTVSQRRPGSVANGLCSVQLVRFRAHCESVARGVGGSGVNAELMLLAVPALAQPRLDGEGCFRSWWERSRTPAVRPVCI